MRRFHIVWQTFLRGFSPAQFRNVRIRSIARFFILASVGLFTEEAFAETPCISKNGDNWVNVCVKDIVFTHTDCGGGVVRIVLKASEGPRYSPSLARQNHERNCNPIILSECELTDYRDGRCTLTMQNPYYR